ncbi:hypothetical protein V1281_007691 [Nitrobacteraceae bacterium AZCC 2161]
MRTMTETAFKTITDRLAGWLDAHPRPRSAQSPRLKLLVLQYWPSLGSTYARQDTRILCVRQHYWGSSVSKAWRHFVYAC